MIEREILGDHREVADTIRSDFGDLLQCYMDSSSRFVAREL